MKKFHILQNIKHMLTFTLLEKLSRLFGITIISLTVFNDSKSLLNIREKEKKLVLSTLSESAFHRLFID